MAEPDGQSRRQPTRSRRLLIPIIAGVVVAALALGFVVYALWPRWPDAPALAEVPHLPIVIAGETFQVPPAAIRMAVQRHPGPQERVDLVYGWPSLAPPSAPSLKRNGTEVVLETQEKRIFISIVPNEGAAAPPDRLRTIYRNYAESERQPAPAGLVVVAFESDSPYQGEDLAYEEKAPEHFMARCARSEQAVAPATCLYERKIGGANVTIRFPRDLLDEWRSLSTKLDRLLTDLHPDAAG